MFHFAAFIEAGESVTDPDKYFRNNTLNGLGLLEAMRDCGVGRLVFSSTAAVYGVPKRLPIEEDDRLEPINPYGASKLSLEYMLRAYAQGYGLGAVSLRYFNIAGAAPPRRHRRRPPPRDTPDPPEPAGGAGQAKRRQNIR